MRGMRFVGPVVLTFATLAMGQQPCPLHIDYFRNGGSYSTLFTEFKNIGDKPIAAWSARVTSLDVLGHEHVLYPTPNLVTQDKKPLAPGKKSSSSFQSNTFLGSGSYRLWLYQVRFADGTTWQDDGSHSCFMDANF